MKGGEGSFSLAAYANMFPVAAPSNPLRRVIPFPDELARGRFDGRRRYVAYGAIGDLISCPRNPNPQFVYALGSIPLADHWAIAATDRIGVRLGYRRNARTDAIPVALSCAH